MSTVQPHGTMVSVFVTSLPGFLLLVELNTPALEYVGR